MEGEVVSSNKKLIKKLVYQKIDPSERQYHTDDKGTITADIYRGTYQHSKKECKGMSKAQIKEHLKRG